jgi:hypothetical protein
MKRPVRKRVTVATIAGMKNWRGKYAATISGTTALAMTASHGSKRGMSS